MFVASAASLEGRHSPDMILCVSVVWFAWASKLWWCMLQRGESSPEVWEAVFGCLIQLPSHNGYTVRAFLEGISQKVVAALLSCCVQHHWSQEVYCQLVRIAVNLLYVPQPTQASSDEDDSRDDDLQGMHCIVEHIALSCCQHVHCI